MTLVADPPANDADFDLDRLEPELRQLGDRLRQRGQRVATAESCTGGLIAAACTAMAGSSDWFDRGFVTYSNAAKTELLGVPTSLLVQHGAVSEPVVQAMACGALERSEAHHAVAVTGIAGPGGGSAVKPVGLVWMAVASRLRTPIAESSNGAPTNGAPTTCESGASRTPSEQQPITVNTFRLQFAGPRSTVRSATVREALRRLLQAAAI